MKEGLNAIVAAHPPIANELDGVASGVPGVPLASLCDHGSRTEVVVNVPHVCGFATGARGPPLKWIFSSPNASCGASLNVPVSCPVTEFAATVPGIFAITPEPSTSIYI